MDRQLRANSPTSGVQKRSFTITGWGPHYLLLTSAVIPPPLRLPLCLQSESWVERCQSTSCSHVSIKQRTLPSLYFCCFLLKAPRSLILSTCDLMRIEGRMRFKLFPFVSRFLFQLCIPTVGPMQTTLPLAKSCIIMMRYCSRPILGFINNRLN